MGKEDVLLGNRDYNGTSMLAGYWSDVIHSKVFELLADNAQCPCKVLDIGAGHGAFSKRLSEAGYEVSAIEYFSNFNVPAATHYKSDLNEDWPESLHDKFDFAVAIEVVEHLENPFHFFRQLHKVLVKSGNGKAIISTPNPLNVQDRWKFLFNGRVDSLKHNDHRNVIFPELMDELCRSSGFNVVKHTYDVDFLKYYSSVKGFIAKKIMKLSSLLLRRQEYILGTSNIWLIEVK
jgi:SAM-dependent methyltransferase